MDAWQAFTTTLALAAVLAAPFLLRMWISAMVRRRENESVPLWRRMLAHVFYSFGLGLLLLGVLSTTSCVLVSGFKVVDTSQTASPGGIVRFSKIETGQKSVRGFWRGLGGQFLPNPDPSGMTDVQPWPVVWTNVHDWGDDILVSAKSEPGSGLPVVVSGDIRVPDDPGLAGRRFDGTLELGIYFPVQTGAQSFANQRVTHSIPYSISVGQPSRVKSSLVLLDRLNRDAGWFLQFLVGFAFLFFGSVIQHGRP
jgi:hypothetical protein